MKLLARLAKNRLAFVALSVLAAFCIIALLAPYVAPYDPHVVSYTDKHEMESLRTPSVRHLLGTTLQGRDVFSQLVYGTRVALLVGIVDAILIGLLGTCVGVVSGYYSGIVDRFLMRTVDILYAIPFEPFAIAVLAMLGTDLWRLMLIIALLLWRDPARVIRAQTLTLMQRSHVKGARAIGASDLRIMVVHVAPGVLPLTFSYVALGAGWSIIAETSVSFLGYGDPNAISWGKMLNDVFVNGQIGNAWWWSGPPGVMIVVLVLSIFLLLRAYEGDLNPRLRKW